MKSVKKQKENIMPRLIRTAGDDILGVLEGVLAIGAVSYLFYHSVLAFFILLPLLYPVARGRSRMLREKKRRQITEQFASLMECVLSDLRCGSSPENAFVGAGEEMAFLYGTRSPVCREIERIRNGLVSGKPLEELLMEFAVRSDSEEILEFAEVFAIGKRGGGGMTEILSRTQEVIGSRIGTEKEIRLQLTARRTEQKIMDAVPFLIIVYISATSRGFFDVLYHNPAGILIMTAALAVYLWAYRLSEKIVQVTV